jgi:2-polyprenyl-6-methoxyphenol hydroxylase-like FAD-dependent oxidoreductase
MASIAVIGGGVGGLTAALLLARDGHEVTLLERDAAAPPAADAAWDDWERRGVNQFRLPHYFLARYRQLLDAELPDVAQAMVDAGALRINGLDAVPAEISGGSRPGDERFLQITGRRPVMEATLARVVAAEPGVTVRRGVAVRGLHAADGLLAGVPHVTGVAVDGGEDLRAELVVDASGRRSSLPDWLEGIGARRPVDESADSGYVYYGRHFRSGDGSVPFMFGAPSTAYDSVTILTLPADNGTWSVTLVGSAKDSVLRAVRDVDVWSKVVAAYPLVTHWLDGEPLTEVDVMAKIEDRLRRLVVDGAPVATGVVALADSWACTNPSIGRGASVAFMHAACLRDVLREVGLEDPQAFTAEWYERTEATVAPYVYDTLLFDRHRRAQLEAQLEGRTYETDDAVWHFSQQLFAATTSSPDLLRGAMAVGNMLQRAPELAADPVVQEALGTAPAAEPPPGPSRSELLSLLG